MTTFVLPIASAFVSPIATTRPANTTAYTANNVVGAAAAVWTFPNMGPAGGHVMLTSADLRIDIAAIPTGMTSFRLYLYNQTPVSALANGAAFDLAVADRVGYRGYIDLGSPADLGSTLLVQTDQINKHIVMDSADTSLYGYLVTNGSYTPAANSEVYNINLRSALLSI